MSQKTGKGTGERRYTSIACLACRKRKVKCNNDRPRCSNCRLYNVECVFGEDRRRLSVSARLNSSTPTSKLGQDGSSSNPTTTSGTSHDEAQHSEVAAPPPDLPANPESSVGPFDLGQVPIDSQANVGFINHSPMLSSDLTQDWEYWIGLGDTADFFSPVYVGETRPTLNVEQSPFVSVQEPLIASLSRGTATPDTSPGSQDATTEAFGDLPSAVRENSADQNSKGEKVRSHDVANEAGPVLDDVTRQITSRLGRLQIAEDGQPRYYGATSNLHLLHSGPQSLCQPNIRNVVTHGDAAIAQAGLQWEEDLAYEDNLIHLFFSWHNALMYVVDKAIFFRERQRFRSGQHTDLYSPALENAVYTIGSAYTDRLHPGIKEGADEFFGFRAKAYLDIEIDSPTIATAQALLVLSSHEAAHARDSRGWIYSGMAVQIISDLGLHLNLDREYSRLGTRDNKDDDVTVLRRNLFWSANTIDTLWSAYSGRPSLMKRLIHNVPSPLPSRTYRWEYYTDEYSIMAFPEDFNFHAASYVHVYLASLMTILARVSEVLYSGVPDISNDIQAFVARANADFQEWLDSLPPHLRLENSSSFHLPAVLELHLIFNECIILLHRPLITPDDASTTNPLSLPDQSGVASPGASFRKCLRSAQEICRLLILFRRRYGLRRPHHQMVHVTMTASLIHVFQLCVSPAGSAESKEAQHYFLTCIQALGEMGQTYKSASRALDVVTSLRQNWQHDAFAGDRFKKARLQ